MIRTSDIPLHVYQVLEEEYLSLHGPLDARPESAGREGGAGHPATVGTRKVRLPRSDRLDSAAASPPDAGHEWREIEAARDWTFRRGHVRDPILLAANLLPRGSAEIDLIPAELAQLLPSYDWSRERLKVYLYEKIDRGLLAELLALGRRDAEAEVPGSLLQRLEVELNKFLADRDLYHPDRVSDNWLSPAGRGLVGLRETLPGGKFRYAEDLTHFNRILLEDAFPEIEKIFDIRFAAVCQKMHEKGQAALCLSGGGIRSGTFALGLLQGMARHNLLKGFDYLSTVSGGGYIGGWLTAWLHRHPEGLEGVTRDLANCPPARKIDPEPSPLLHLRQFSNFLTPKVGLLTADTWAFVGIYFRNLLLNWMVFIPLLAALLLVPRLLLAVTLMQPVDYYPEPYDLVRYVNNFFYRNGRHVFLGLGFVLGTWALAYIDFNRPGLREQLRQHSRFWRDRTDQGSFIRWCLAPLVAAAALLTTYMAWSSEYYDESKDWWVILLFGVAFIGVAGLISSVVLSRHRQAEHGGEHTAHPPGQLWNKAIILFCLAVASLFAGLIFWAISRGSLGTPVITYRPQPPDGQPFNYAAWSGVLDWTTELYVCLAVPAFLLVFWGATTVFVGVTSVFTVVSDDDREWWARLGAWLLIAALAWAAGNALVIYGPVALLDSPRLLTAAGGLSGLGALLLGRSAKTSGHKDDEAKAGGASALVGKLLPLLALIFLAAFLATLSLGTSYLIRGLAGFAGDRAGAFASPPAQVVKSACEEEADRRRALALAERVEQRTSPAARGEREARLREAPNALCEEEARRREAPVEWLTNANEFADYARYIGLAAAPPAATPAPTPAAAPTPTPSPSATPTPSPTPTPTPAPADKYAAENRAKLVHFNVLHHTSLWFTLALALGLSVFGWGLSRWINLNIFSLHGSYRNRLIRGFLGASRPLGERRPNPFTGFDPADNVPMHELRPGLLDEDDFPDPQKLSEALADKGHQLSAYIISRQEVAGDSAAASAPSGGDVLALRTDLNRVLAEESLYEHFDGLYLQSARARRIKARILAAYPSPALRKDLLRTDYHVLLNRLVLEEAYPGLVKPARYPPPPYKLMHVVNTTLNLVGGNNLAWQQRKAEPFSISPLHAGCFRLGYRESRDYGGGRKTGGISIGTATAISGAAASSNMGYYTTSPIMSLLLTLFNVRLGWWLGNPGAHGSETYQDPAPRSSVTPVVSEAFGSTDDRNPYVYLTDGGHFENLALYEMVLRRCRVIVCSDGAQDEEYRFGDLGNAVRKIRIDLGIPIEFTRVPIYAERPDAAEGRGLYFAIGRIRYSCADVGAPDGVLLYIKPAVYGREPRDILEYKKSFPAFPHQSTGDQFFDEPQFESYRALGSFVMDMICGEGSEELDLYEMLGRAYDLLTEKKEEHPPSDRKLKDWMKDWLAPHLPSSPPS